jgi:hypothetical protein
MAESYPHWELDVERHMSRTMAGRHRYPDVVECQARGRRHAYGSIMCSIPGDGGGADEITDSGTGTAEIVRLGRALDELADAAQARDAEAEDVAAILNRAWEMVTRLDPELARRLAGYGS